MRLQNISTQKISQVLSETISRGEYTVPHIVDELPIGSSERKCLKALIKLQALHISDAKEARSWFPVRKKEWRKYSDCAKETFKRARQRLKYMRLIDYRSAGGRYNRKTECRILLDQSYLYDLVATMGKEVSTYKNTAPTETKAPNAAEYGI